MQICLPKYTVCTDTKILQDEPDTEFVVLIMQAKRTRAECSYEITGEHARWLMGSIQCLLLVRELVTMVRRYTAGTNDCDLPCMQDGWVAAGGMHACTGRWPGCCSFRSWWD